MANQIEAKLFGHLCRSDNKTVETLTNKRELLPKR
jgi:hypothetical protein